MSGNDPRKTQFKLSNFFVEKVLISGGLVRHIGMSERFHFSARKIEPKVMALSEGLARMRAEAPPCN